MGNNVRRARKEIRTRPGGERAEEVEGDGVKALRQAPLPAHHLSIPSSLEYMAARLLSLPSAPLRFFGRLSHLSTLSDLVMVGISIWLLEVHSTLLEVGDWPCSLNPSSWHRAWARALRNVLRKDEERQLP